MDAVGFLAFSHVYTANMSGNSVAAGIALGKAQWVTFVFRFWPVLIYVFGLLFGRVIIEVGVWQRVRRVASIAFAFEAFIILAVCFWSAPFATEPGRSLESAVVVYGGIGLLAFAMGIQNSAMTHFSSLTLHSGFVTGTLLKFAEEFTGYLTWLVKTSRHSGISKAIRQSSAHESFRASSFLALVWMAYLTGALLGAVGQSRAELKALTIPLLILCLLIILDLRLPLAVRDEQEQARIH